jgi:hypothetical protein
MVSHNSHPVKAIGNTLVLKESKKHRSRTIDTIDTIDAIDTIDQQKSAKIWSASHFKTSRCAPVISESQGTSPD